MSLLSCRGTAACHLSAWLCSLSSISIEQLCKPDIAVLSLHLSVITGIMLNPLNQWHGGAMGRTLDLFIYLFEIKAKRQYWPLTCITNYHTMLNMRNMWPMINRLWVQILRGAKLCNNLGQLKLFTPIWLCHQAGWMTNSHLQTDCLYTRISFVPNAW